MVDLGTEFCNAQEQLDDEYTAIGGSFDYPPVDS